MNYSILSDKGIIRANNQDSCFAGSPDDSSCLTVVCDGMGGANAGEIASKLAVDIISERVMSGWRKNISRHSVENLFTSAIAAANICVYDEANSDKSKNGMGTTVVAAGVSSDFCVIAHAGDSRAYLINSEIKRLTKDHSYVQSLVDVGLITAKEAATHPKKNYITRALGINEHLECDFTHVKVSKGDIVLLCSDGLSNYVQENEIFSVVTSCSQEEAVKRLVNMANINGGGDNITVAIIAV